MKFTLIIIVWLLGVHLASGRQTLQEFGLSTIIPKVELKGADLAEAIKVITAAADAAGAIEKGFNGVVLEEGWELKPKRISMHLVNVPVLKAIEFSADQYGLSCRIQDGVVVVGLPKGELVTSFKVTDNIRNGLGLEDKLLPANILKSFTRMGLKLEVDSIVAIGDSVIISSNFEDIIFLKSLLLVVERGLRVDPMNASD